MSDEKLTTLMQTLDDEINSQLFFKRPIIKILTYTDDPDLVKEHGGLFGLGDMRKHVQAHAPFFADVRFKFISRSSDCTHHADSKLDSVLNNETYDQIWFFGIHQVNKEKCTLGVPGGGGPQSELIEAEVSKLEEWMRVDQVDQSKGIGVLMTGDHANPPPGIVLPAGEDAFCPRELDHKKFLGLGRALGHLVPRAGLLRRWEGPPTSCVVDNFNTQVLAHGTNIEDSSLEIDSTPQQLIPEKFDATGNPAPGGQPHPLFIGRAGQWIEVFPDHMHEGEVITEIDKTQWPKGAVVQPTPQVVAYGTDKRNGQRLNIVAAYDGDSASVGRIVVDSTWHHYFNINLENFKPGAEEGSAADQIGQFYANLTVWLTPLAKRREMACAMFWWLANHPLMLEEVGSGALNIGRIAYQILSRKASYCEIHEVLLAACPETLRCNFNNLYFPDSKLAFSHLPSKELIVGSVINEYHNAMGAGREDGDYRDIMSSGIIERGFSQAFLMKFYGGLGTAIKSLDILQFLPLLTLNGEGQEALRLLKTFGASQLISERRNTMTGCALSTTSSTNARIELTLDKDGSNAIVVFRFDKVDESRCNTDGGVTTCLISGKVDDSLGNELSEVTGNCISLESISVDLSLMILDFRLPGAHGEVGVLMSGFVYVPTKDFNGRFRCYTPDRNTPRLIGVRPLDINPDTGDTGTGGGSVTLLVAGQDRTKEQENNNQPEQPAGN